VSRALRLISHILVAVFTAVLVYYGILLCIRSAARPFQGISWLSYSWVTASLPFSGLLMLITSLRKIYYEFILKTEVPILENPDKKAWNGGNIE
jgi:TRAP-type C4-dicarboxylate transport system permease small subunit